MNAEDMTDRLRGYTIVRHLEFSSEPETGTCNLLLELVEGEEPDTRAIRAEFFGVTNLSLKDFGGGLTQLLCLSVADISDRQLDRINYQVTELERESLSFLCRSFDFGGSLH